MKRMAGLIAALGTYLYLPRAGGRGPPAGAHEGGPP